MVSTGSKFFYGLAGVGLLAAVVYGIITNGLDHGGVIHVLTGDGAVDALLGPLTLGYKGGVGDHVGYTVLMAFAASSFGLGLATSFFRDGDPEALAELDGAEGAPAIVAPAGLSFWPIILAVAAAAGIIGLAASPPLFVVAVVVAVMAGTEWAVEVWADSATGDPAVNKTVRGRLMHPIEVPLAGILGVAVVMFSLSRIFIATTGVGAMVVATALAAVVFVGAIILSAQPQVKRTVGVAAAVLFAVAVLAMGIGGAIAGAPEHEGHEPHPAAEQIETGAPANSAIAVELGETE